MWLVAFLMGFGVWFACGTCHSGSVLYYVVYRVALGGISNQCISQRKERFNFLLYVQYVRRESSDDEERGMGGALGWREPPFLPTNPHSHQPSPLIVWY